MPFNYPVDEKMTSYRDESQQNFSSLKSTIDLKDFFHSSSDFMFLLNADLEIVELNHAAIDLSSKYSTRKDFIGKKIIEIYPEITNEDINLLYDLYKNNLKKTIHKKIQLNRGLYQTYNIQVFRSGDYLGIIGHDGTKFTQIENKLLKNEDIFQFFLNTIHNEIIIHDLNGKILYVNDFTAENTRYTKKKLLSFKIHDLDPNTERLSFREKYWLNLQENKSIKYKSIHRKKDGTIYQVEKTLIKTEYNHTKILIEFIRDLSKMDLNEIWFRNILKSFPNAIVLLDLEGKIVNCNQITAKC